jgi:hypothetical protein
MMTNRQRDIDGEVSSRSGMDVDRDRVVDQVMQEELTKLRKVGFLCSLHEQNTI